MMRQKLKYHQVFKLLIILSSALGLSLTIIDGSGSLRPFAYFTNLSNLLVLVIYTYYLIQYKSYHEPFISILYQGVLAIVLTGIVYHLMLRPYIDLDTLGSRPLTDLMVHTITPLLVVIERLIFSVKGVLQKSHPLYWLTFPLIYFIFTRIYARLGGLYQVGTEYESKYPYFFLNFQSSGYLYFILVILMVIFLGYTIYFLNRHILYDREG